MAQLQNVTGEPILNKVEQLSGQITVATAGTAVQGPDVALKGGAYVKAMGANGGKVYVGNDGLDDVTTLNGYELAAGEVSIWRVDNMNKLWFDAATSGDKFCWMKA